MNEIQIRKYLPIDRESCRGLWRELTEWHREIYEDQTIGGSSPEDFFDQHLSKVGAHNLWVATLESRVVGLAGLIIDEKEGEVEPLIVSQPYRNRGIGTKLIEAMIAETRQRGIRYLNVKPVARNVDAIKFFYNHGFDNIGHIQLFLDFSQQQWKKSLTLFNYQFHY